MMKKLISVSAVAMGLMLTGHAHAAATAIAGTVPISVEGGTYNCFTLNNNVTIQLSNNVQGSFACDAAGTKFEAGTCHSQGTNKTQTYQCSWTTPDGGVTWVPNIASCGTDNTKAGSATFTGRTGFYGNSNGGRVGPSQFLQAECTASTVTSLTPNY